MKTKIRQNKTETDIPIKEPTPPAQEPVKEAVNETKEVTIPAGLADLHADIYRTIATLGQPTQDEIIAQSGLSASNAMVALTVLEIKGHILSLPGGRYCVQK